MSICIYECIYVDVYIYIYVYVYLFYQNIKNIYNKDALGKYKI